MNRKNKIYDSHSVKKFCAQTIGETSSINSKIIPEHNGNNILRMKSTDEINTIGSEEIGKKPSYDITNDKKLDNRTGTKSKERNLMLEVVLK